MVKIRDNVTGQIIEVPEEKLGEYGLSGGASSMPQPQQVQPQIQQSQVNQQPQVQKTITGHTLEEHAQALQQAQAAGDTQQAKIIKENYDREYQYQKDFAKGDNSSTDEAAMLELAKQGVLKVEDIAKANPTLAQKALLQGAKGTVTKKNESLDSTLNFINNLEKHYQGAGGASFGEGPLARVLGIKTTAEGKLGLNDASRLYGNQKEGFAATLKSLTGDTGVLTDQDYARLAKLLPGLGATPGEATGSFNDLRSQISAKYGGEPTQTTITPGKQAKNKKTSGNPLTDTITENPILNFLLGTSARTAQDIGTGIRSRGTKKSLEGNDQVAQVLENQATQTENMEERKSLLAQANQIRNANSREAENIAKSFSKDVNDNPILRGVGSGVEIAGVAELPALIKALPMLGKKAMTSPKSVAGKLFTQDKGSAIRNEAVKLADETGQSVQGTRLFSAVDDWAVRAKKANPASSKTIDKYVAGAKESFADKTLKPSEAFDLWDDARKGFTAAGTKGASLEASYHRAMRDIIRKELDAAAPGFEKGTQLIKKGLQRREATTRVGRQVGSTALGVGATLATLKLLKTLGISTE